MLQTAYSTGRERLGLLMETICASGIRVSEVQYITVEAAKKGRAEIFLKGKIRTILIPGKLARKLCQYAKKQKITSGEIFLTKGGRSLSRKQIWAEMKKTLPGGKGESEKGFPSQFEASICHGVLSGVQGYRQVGGCVGTFQH